MGNITVNHEKEYLQLDRLEIKSSINGLLPYDIARRYHALPISRDGKKITVVMADPSDLEAKNAILDTLGSSTYFVKADLQVIDDSLDLIWAKQSTHAQLILVWTRLGRGQDEIESYAADLASLLSFRVNQSRCHGEGKIIYKDLADEVEILNPHLMIFGIPQQPAPERPPPILSEPKLVECLPVSLLFVHKPRLPLKKLLLVIHHAGTDDAAIDWAVLLARRSGAAITILPILAPIPLMYSGLNRLRHNLPTLLTTNCPLGRKMRQIVRRLNEWEIDGTLRLRGEEPEWQIRAELLEGDYDLIIIACERHNRLVNFICGGFVKSILDWAEQPVLISKTSPV